MVDWLNVPISGWDYSVTYSTTSSATNSTDCSGYTTWKYKKYFDVLSNITKPKEKEIKEDEVLNLIKDDN